MKWPARCKLTMRGYLRLSIVEKHEEVHNILHGNQRNVSTMLSAVRSGHCKRQRFEMQHWQYWNREPSISTK
jgi:hypothetical protein